MSGEIPTNMYLVMQVTSLCSSSHRKLWTQQQQTDIWVTNFCQAVVHLVRSGETKHRWWATSATLSSMRIPCISWKRKLKHLISSEALGYSPSLLRCFLASHTEVHDSQSYVAFVSRSLLGTFGDYTSGWQSPGNKQFDLFAESSSRWPSLATE